MKPQATVIDRAALRARLVALSNDATLSASERKLYGSLLSDVDMNVPTEEVAQNLSKYEMGQAKPAAGKVTGANFIDATGKEFWGVPDDKGQIHRDSIDGEVVTNVRRTAVTPGSQLQSTIVQQNGVPIGIKRFVERTGQVATVHPGDADWSVKDQEDFQAALGGAATAFKSKEQLQDERMKAFASTYAKMRGQVQQYSVIDTTTGLPTMVNSNIINANPGRYMAGSLGQQLKNRAVVFDEINYTAGQFNDALGAMTDNDFKTLPRAQIAAALQTRDPASAMSLFVGSEAATSLSPTQVDYVTGLAAMQESAMSLRSIAGMGQGSDTLRAAITGMLPSGTTPSKAYALRQMQLFEGELNKLRQAVPPSPNLGIPSTTQDNTPPAGANVRDYSKVGQ